MQAIVISGSPKMGLNDQSALENAIFVESGEASPTPAAIQVIHLPKQASGRPERPRYTRVECSRALLPDRLLLNSHLPLQGLTPPMEEVLAPGPEGAQEIINLWRPFNSGKSSAYHFYELYPALFQMPLTMRAEGRGEEYVVSVPASTGKEDLLQMDEDGMLVRNRNFAQSTKLVLL